MWFAIDWLLCSVAFAVCMADLEKVPPAVAAVLKIALSGVLVAIAINLTPGGLG